MNKSLRSVSPTPRSARMLATTFSDSSSHFGLRRKVTPQERTTLQTIIVDERDIDLLREFIEHYHGNLKVFCDEILSWFLESGWRDFVGEDISQTDVYEWNQQQSEQ